MMKTLVGVFPLLEYQVQILSDLQVFQQSKFECHGKHGSRIQLSNPEIPLRMIVVLCMPACNSLNILLYIWLAN